MCSENSPPQCHEVAASNLCCSTLWTLLPSAHPRLSPRKPVRSVFLESADAACSQRSCVRDSDGKRDEQVSDCGIVTVSMVRHRLERRRKRAALWMRQGP